MIKLLLTASLISLGGVAVSEYADYKEAKRLFKCTGTTQDELFQCLEDRSLLYKIIPERPRIYLCLVPGEQNAPTRLCNLLGITQE